MSQPKKTYSTSQVARVVSVHPNTIRKYEEWALITKPQRKLNGYREFSELHLCQVKLIRAAFRVELVQSNLRSEVVEIVRASADGDFDRASTLAAVRHSHLVREREVAERAVEIASGFCFSAVGATVLDEGSAEAVPNRVMTRAQAARFLQTTIDCLRNWEMNGLLQVKRRQSGYRVYNTQDLNRLALIRALRMGNYSLASIRRLLETLEANPSSDVRQVLNTPEATEDIVSACDRLLSSFDEALQASEEIAALIEEMKKIIS